MSTAICSPSSSTALLLTQSHELENSLDKSNDEHAQKVFSEDAEAVQMANNIMQRLKDDDEVKGQLFRNAELDASTILSLLSNLVQESAPMKNTTVKLQRVAMKTNSNSGLQRWVSSLLRYPLFGFLRTNTIGL